MTETASIRDHRTHEERAMAERFPADIAKHKLTVLREDGLYRHLRCAAPGSSFYWFEVVTWPGTLAIRGDFGEAYVFSRLDDMFAFFRSGRGEPRINPHYWSEKLPDCGRSVKVHSERVVRDRIDEALSEYETEEYPELLAAYEREHAALLEPLSARGLPRPVAPTEPATLRELYADYETDDRLRFADGARQLLAEMEEAGVVSDTWEWDLTDWDWPFLWACHAIVWAIGQYDRAKAVEAGSGA